MIRTLLFFICACCSISLSAQEKTVLRGKIEAESLMETAINIINLTQKTGTVNTASGSFEIEVTVNDSLWFSSVQYEQIKIKVTQELIEIGFLEIRLEENVNELSEVRLTNVGLSGNLTKDLSEIPTFTPVDMGFSMSDKPIPTSIERKLHTAKGVQKHSVRNPPGQVNVSLDGIINTFNGKIEMLEKAKENQDLNNLVIAGMNALPDSFFVEELQLPPSEVKNFIYFCTETIYFKSLLRKEKMLELIEFYQRKAPEFIEERMGK
ncbi:hypothetical protein [Salinimicrobium marinum]|uniref:hypothetical protein n=1 Tax=Salinimicrobium marinum TaxID=680283 RepID=UPI00167BC551|nr:hypothetical protein [Salinimicrobium marinum]